MKKEYMKPAMQVVVLQHMPLLQGGSPYNDKKTPLDTYDDPEDVIDDEDNIW